MTNLLLEGRLLAFAFLSLRNIPTTEWKSHIPNRNVLAFNRRHFRIVRSLKQQISQKSKKDHCNNIRIPQETKMSISKSDRQRQAGIIIDEVRNEIQERAKHAEQRASGNKAG